MLDTLTVLDYIAFNAGIYDSTIHTKEIALLTVYFLLGEKIKSKVSNLSGGQKQRLNALLAFTHLPEIVFVDEVTNEIDKKGRKLILDFIKDYFTNKNITLISISHDLYETEKLGEKVYEIKDRKIIESKEIIPKLKKMSKSLHDYENVF
jgi:ABC-2 type transport system ATP-binding protein